MHRIWLVGYLWQQSIVNLIVLFNEKYFINTQFKAKILSEGDWSMIQWAMCNMLASHKAAFLKDGGDTSIGFQHQQVWVSLSTRFQFFFLRKNSLALEDDAWNIVSGTGMQQGQVSWDDSGQPRGQRCRWFAMKRRGKLNYETMKKCFNAIDLDMF